jgi:hypothetical protein
MKNVFEIGDKVRLNPEYRYTYHNGVTTDHVGTIVKKRESSHRINISMCKYPTNDPRCREVEYVTDVMYHVKWEGVNLLYPQPTYGIRLLPLATEYKVDQEPMEEEETL